MAYTHTYVELLDWLSRRGCPVCGLLLRDEKRYLESLLYEFANDAGIQQAFRHGRGLCNHHSWLLTHHYGYSLGVSFLFEAALDEVISILETEHPTSGETSLETVISGWLGGKGRNSLADKLKPQISCLACDSLCEAEARYLSTFAQYWSDAALQSAYQQSNGLCLPHFREVLRRISAQEARAQLVTMQRAKWESLKQELRQYQVKSAYNYVGEGFGADADSWRRAVASMTGGEHAPVTLTRSR